MIWAIILAAGESKRMGRPKMLLPWKGTTILETVVHTALASSVDRVLVVLGPEQEQISQLLSPFPVETVHNPDFRMGMLSSVKVGFAALPGEARAGIVLLGDQPFVSAGVIDRLCAASAGSPGSIMLPVYEGRRGHPVLIPAAFRDEIPLLSDAVGLRELIHRHEEKILEIEVEEEDVLLDIDDPEAYYAAIKGKR
jgi:molybdenum cofactor cytidylyltransferase